MVVTKIEHTELFQTADPLRYFCQLVVSQNQSFELRLLPHIVWHVAELLLPKVEMTSGGLWHRVMLPHLSLCGRAGETAPHPRH